MITSLAVPLFSPTAANEEKNPRTQEPGEGRHWSHFGHFMAVRPALIWALVIAVGVSRHHRSWCFIPVGFILITQYFPGIRHPQPIPLLLRPQVHAGLKTQSQE